MKYIIVAATLWAALLTGLALAEEAPAPALNPATQEFAIKLTTAEWQVVLNGLNKLPREMSNDVFGKVVLQYRSLIAAAAVKPKEDVTATPPGDKPPPEVKDSKSSDKK